MKHGAAWAALALVLITVAAGIPTSALAAESGMPLSVDPPLRKWQVQEWLFAGDPVVSPNGTTYILVGRGGDPGSGGDPMMRAYASDGTLLWERQMHGRVSVLSPEADGHVFILEKETKAVGDEPHRIARLIRLDGSGASEWSWENEVLWMGTEVQEACIVDGRAYVIATSWYNTSLPSRVYALERNGSLRWTVDIAANLATISHEPRLGGLLISSLSAVFRMQENGSYEKIVNMDGHWFSCSPMVGPENIIYVAAERGTFPHLPHDSPTEIRAYGLDGVLQWNFTMPLNQTAIAKTWVRQLICLEDGRLLVVGYGGEWLDSAQRFGPFVMCLDGNGTMQWRTEMGHPYSDAVLSADRLYVCSEHDLLEMDLGGHVLRRYTSMWLADIQGLAIGSDGSFHFLEISNSGQSTLYATAGFPVNSLLDGIINNFFQLVAAALGAVLILCVFRRHMRGWY
ncbi:MAG: PQQ-binding-like beta-propeller repeat protein [Methanomassiliicoccales archaeon]